MSQRRSYAVYSACSPDFGLLSGGQNGVLEENMCRVVTQRFVELGTSFQALSVRLRACGRRGRLPFPGFVRLFFRKSGLSLRREVLEFNTEKTENWKHKGHRDKP